MVVLLQKIFTLLCNMQIIVRTEGESLLFEKQQSVPPVVIPSGKFGVVNLDYDQSWFMDSGKWAGKWVTHLSRCTRNGVGGNTINGLPATARFMVAGGIPDTVDLHSDLQLWWHGLCRERIPGTSDEEAKASWRSLTSGTGMAARFMTDFAGTDTHADYVSGHNLDKGPAKAKPMVTGGAILKIIGERVVGGTDCWIVEAIDPVGNYRQFNPRDHFWLFFYPTISLRKPIFDTKGNFVKFLEYLSIPFPQYKDNALAPVFGAAGRSENYQPKSRMKIIDINQPLPSPYLNSTVVGSETRFYASPY